VSDHCISIRLASSEDVTSITDIYNEAIRTTTATFDTEPKTAEDRLKWLESHDERHPVFVAELDGRVAGWASLTKWSDRPAYNQTAETSFYVGEAFRGRGVGSALKERLIEEARRLGFHTLLARTARESFASIHINESFGFRQIGTMKEVGFKFGRRLDVHVMQLMLNEQQDSPPRCPTETGVALGAILNSYELHLQHLRRLVADLDDKQMVSQPNNMPNHPAWTIGHLVYSCQTIGGELGLSAWLSDDWEQRFGTGSTPVADAAAYPSKATLLGALGDGKERVVAALVSLGETGLARSLPDVRYRERFPTIGHAVTHILSGHTALHLGQLTVWRWAMGLKVVAETLDDM
jgi:phosphinothricin acetyltransferase